MMAYDFEIEIRHERKFTALVLEKGTLFCCYECFDIENTSCDRAQNVYDMVLN